MLVWGQLVFCLKGKEATPHTSAVSEVVSLFSFVLFFQEYTRTQPLKGRGFGSDIQGGGVDAGEENHQGELK